MIDNALGRKYMDLLTTTEMSKQWNISRRRIATLCKEGRIPGSILKGKTWLIPAGTPKPHDARHATDDSAHLKHEK